MLSRTFMSSVYVSSAFVLSLMSHSALAKPENAYGPVYSGQTLWDIAAEVRPDDSVSIVQLVHSLYALNPSAFASGNMNLLRKGVYLEMPTKDKVLSMTRQEAQGVFKQHSQALVSLRAGAGSLNKAKANRTKYRKQVKQLQSKLGRLRHKSSAWDKVYAQLLKSKKRKKKWENKVASIREVLVNKTISPEPSVAPVDDKPIDKPATKSLASNNANSTAGATDFASLNSRMDKLQASVNELQTKLGMSNKSLEEKIKAQAAMEQRFTVLESELGKKEKIILKLRSTLRVAATAMKKQQVENKALNKRLQEVDPNYKPVNAKPSLTLQSTDAGTKKVAEATTTTTTEVMSALASAPVAQKAVEAVKANVAPVKTTVVEPMTAKSTTAPAPKVSDTKPQKKLSRDEKRRLRMAKANQGGDSVASIAYWKNLVTQNLIAISAVLGGLLFLVIGYTVIGGKRKKRLKAKALEEKHNNLFVEAGRLSDINTGDSNVSTISMKKAS